METYEFQPCCPREWLDFACPTNGSAVLMVQKLSQEAAKKRAMNGARSPQAVLKLPKVGYVMCNYMSLHVTTNHPMPMMGVAAPDVPSHSYSDVNRDV